MRKIEAVDMWCGVCGNSRLFQTATEPEKAGWSLSQHAQGDRCPQCAAKEKPDGALTVAELGASEVAELKAQVKELQIALERVRVIRIETQDKLNDIVSDVRQH